MFSILFAVPELSGGVLDSTYELAEALAEANHRVTVQEMKDPFSRNLLNYVKGSAEIVRLISHKNIEIVHLQFEPAFFGFCGLGFVVFCIVIQLARIALRKKHFAITLHEISLPHEALREGNILILRKLFRIIHRTVMLKLIDIVFDAIITQNEFSRHELLYYVKDKRKLHAILHGTKLVSKLPNKDQCKRKLGFEDKFVMLLFGMPRAEKGYDLAIRALCGLSQRVMLVIAGHRPFIRRDVEYTEQLLTLIQELGVSDRVFFYWDVPTGLVPTIFHTSDVVLLPYRGVTASSVLHKAVAYNKPVIASRLPYFTYVGRAYRRLLTFEVDSSKELALVIDKMINKELRGSFNGEASQFAKMTDWNVIAKRYENLYRSITLHG